MAESVCSGRGGTNTDTKASPNADTDAAANAERDSNADADTNSYADADAKDTETLVAMVVATHLSGLKLGP